MDKNQILWKLEQLKQLLPGDTLNIDEEISLLQSEIIELIRNNFSGASKDNSEEVKKLDEQIKSLREKITPKKETPRNDTFDNFAKLSDAIGRSYLAEKQLELLMQQIEAKIGDRELPTDPKTPEEKELAGLYAQYDRLDSAFDRIRANCDRMIDYRDKIIKNANLSPELQEVYEDFGTYEVDFYNGLNITSADGKDMAEYATDLSEETKKKLEATRQQIDAELKKKSPEVKASLSEEEKRLEELEKRRAALASSPASNMKSKFLELQKRLDTLKLSRDIGWDKPQTKISELIKKHKSGELSKEELETQVVFLMQNMDNMFDFRKTEKAIELSEIRASRESYEQRKKEIIEKLSSKEMQVETYESYSNKIADLDREILQTWASSEGLSVEEWRKAHSFRGMPDTISPEEIKKSTTELEQMSKSLNQKLLIVQQELKKFGRTDLSAEERAKKQELENRFFDLKSKTRMCAASLKSLELWEKREKYKHAREMASSKHSEIRTKRRELEALLDAIEQGLSALNNREEYLKSTDKIPELLSQLAQILGLTTEHQAETPLEAEAEHQPEVPQEAETEQQAETSQEAETEPKLSETDEDEHRATFAKSDEKTISKFKKWFAKNKALLSAIVPFFIFGPLVGITSAAILIALEMKQRKNEEAEQQAEAPLETEAEHQPEVPQEAEQMESEEPKKKVDKESDQPLEAESSIEEISRFLDSFTETHAL